LLTTSLDARAVVIGGSAGAIEVLMTLLPAVGAHVIVPIIVVVHVPSGTRSMLVEVFSPRCPLPVREPLDKQPIESGIWFASEDYHLMVEIGHTFALSQDEPCNFSRPSIDALFESAADCFGDGLVSIVLSGGSKDGSLGSREVLRRGGRAFAQDPRCAEVPFMPAAAVEVGAVVTSIDDLRAMLTFSTVGER
jgi:two-component system chemotaxis response regulator CheB